MGYGEYSGNGSVHWTVVHQDGIGTNKTKKVKKVNANKTNAPKSTDPENVHAADKEIRGRDGIAFAQIGESGNHGGKFRVRVRFKNQTDAQTELAKLQAVPVTGSQGMWEIVLHTAAIPRLESALDPQPTPECEVRVEW